MNFKEILINKKFYFNLKLIYETKLLLINFMNNLTGMNFYKTQNKPKLISNLANQYNENDLRSSSAIDQRVHSVGKRVGYEDKVNIAIPKILKNKINYVGLDIVKNI